MWIFCEEQNIKIYVVTGGGYAFKEEFANYLQTLTYEHIEFTSATGVISQIMEKTPVAITSNGRTVYELAHMNIPSIVVSHHARERSHHFAEESQGFIHVGEYKIGETERQILESFKKLVLSQEYRKQLFENIQPYDFVKNKSKVVNIILSLLHN